MGIQQSTTKPYTKGNQMKINNTANMSSQIGTHKPYEKLLYPQVNHIYDSQGRCQTIDNLRQSEHSD